MAIVSLPRLAALPVRNPADALLGMAWWNALTGAERALWLDRAWKRVSPPGQYSLNSMPAAADAWTAFKASTPSDREAQALIAARRAAYAAQSRALLKFSE